MTFLGKPDDIYFLHNFLIYQEPIAFRSTVGKSKEQNMYEYFRYIQNLIENKDALTSAIGSLVQGEVEPTTRSDHWLKNNYLGPLKEKMPHGHEKWLTQSKLGINNLGIFVILIWVPL
ncbi:hypothetical protein ACJX0J_026532, partial [Zea mays]